MNKKLVIVSIVLLVMGVIGGFRTFFSDSSDQTGKDSTVVSAKTEQSTAAADATFMPTLTPTVTPSPDVTTKPPVEKTAKPKPTKKPDTKAPVISGFVGKKSYCGKFPYMVVYSNDKHYDYFKYVKAKDNRDKKVKLKVDTSKVNFKKSGIYKITYIATDSSGNTSKKKAKIQVRVPNSLDKLADKVLKKITKKKWSKFKKAKAIYDYTRNKINYTGYSDKTDWEGEAKRGFTFGDGDCFNYYAVARALLTRVGIPNIEVTRYKGEGHHWWSKVYIKGGWYHYDCFPRTAGAKFCMVTDKQLKDYDKKTNKSRKYIWNYKKIPKSPKKVIAKLWIR